MIIYSIIEDLSKHYLQKKFHTLAKSVNVRSGRGESSLLSKTDFIITNRGVETPRSDTFKGEGAAFAAPMG